LLNHSAATHRFGCSGAVTNEHKNLGLGWWKSVVREDVSTLRIARRAHLFSREAQNQIINGFTHITLEDKPSDPNSRRWSLRRLPQIEASKRM
jgi:hypothetical protein